MKSKLISAALLLVLLIPVLTFSQSNSADNQQSFKQPRLVIGIVVDQMRSDYIYRYWNKLSNDGFKRLIHEGYECKNAQYNNMPTYTGPDHASIYTGTTPAIHGIIGNDWFDPAINRVIYCAFDNEVHAVTGIGGQLSPKRLLTTTIGDELRLFSNFRSKVIGISLKDRAAIFPAGKSGDAYWLDDITGNFITSTYYLDKKNSVLPKWINEFNDRKLSKIYLDSVWSPLYDIKSYTESTSDNESYEESLDITPGALPVFNYDLNKLRNRDPELLRKTPFGNQLLKEFAIAAIEGENLGKDSVCDMLLISFSATDYIGHAFATHAIETEDTYLRLDLEIANFLKYLDKKIGKDNLLLFLTADHGALSNPLFLNEHKLPGGYIEPGTITDTINYFFRINYNDARLFKFYLNDQVWLNDSLMQIRKMNKQKVSEELGNFLMKFEYVADVVNRHQLESFEYREGRRSLVQNGFNYQRSGDLAIIFQPGYIEKYGSGKGTTHGSPYRYDTSVPLLWYGWKIKSGSTSRQINITDIAATVAGMLNICQPSGCNGKVIEELMK